MSDMPYSELAYYSLSHPDPRFIHQHVVDAFTAQNADKQTKPIALFFALAGLYLSLEKGYTGRQVQQAHLAMAKKKDRIPLIPVPEQKGAMTIHNVLRAIPGEERDGAIRHWCASVWEAYSAQQATVITATEAVLQEGNGGT